MELTIWGIIFVPLSIILILFAQHIAVCFLIFSLSLQMTSILILPTSNYGFQLYKFLLILFSFYFIIKTINNRGILKIQNFYLKKISVLLLLFLLYLILISSVGPFIFSDIPVFPPLLGLDYSAFFGPSPLEFSTLNVVLPLYILLYTLTFLYIISYNIQEKDIKTIILSWKITVFLTILLLLIQFTFFFIINGDVLEYIGINNSPQGVYGFVQFENLGSVFPRLRGTFQEPSMVSPFLIGIFMYKLAQLRKTLRSILSVIIIFILLFLTASTTAYISFAIMFAIYLILNLPFKYKDKSFFIHKRKAKIVIAALFLIIFASLIFGIGFGFDRTLFYIFTFILKKPETSSFYSRTEADIHSLQLFLDTFFIGVGMGSHRGSSLIFNLLAIVGIVGTTLFFMFIYAFLKYSYKVLKNTDYFPYFYLLPSILVPMSISIPDLTFPTFWQFLYITVLAVKIVEYKKMNENKILR